MKKITQLLITAITPMALLASPSLSFAQAPAYPVQNYSQGYPMQPGGYSYPPANIFLTPYGRQLLQNPQAAMPKTVPKTIAPQIAIPPQTIPQPQQLRQQVTQPQTNLQQTRPTFREFSGYLGIGTDILPSSVAAQLPKGLSQGILIKEFAPDSPANVSDLKPFDVLVAYGETKINHPEQFIKLVRNDSPSNKVILKVVRKGQVLDIPITLGSQKTPNPKEFNGLAIIQAGKNTYTASIRYIGKNGNKQIRLYKGTREEIFQQALEARDLPPAERQQLLFATRPRNNNNSNSGFGSFFPFGGGKNESGKDWMNPSRFFKF